MHRSLRECLSSSSLSSSILSLAVLVVGCGGPLPEADAGPDGGPRLPSLRDAGPLPDVVAPPPPVCRGAAVRCAERLEEECEAGAGCRLERCGGEPEPCERQSSRELCDLVQGCFFNGEDCYGLADPCGPITNGTRCNAQGCAWDFSGRGTCVGVADVCPSLSAQDCETQPGCESALDAGPPDAGPIDAGPDGGPDGGPDAGALCMADGLCDPFSSGSCGANQSCVPQPDDGTRCVTLGFSPDPEGSPCAIDNDCAPGLACTGSPLRCRRLCRAGSTGDCTGADDVCGRPVEAARPCLRYCTAACDLYEQDCPSGEACVSFVAAPGDSSRTVTCLQEGGVAIGASCQFANDCVRGGACVGRVCEQLCRETSECDTGVCQPTGAEGIDTCS